MNRGAVREEIPNDDRDVGAPARIRRPFTKEDKMQMLQYLLDEIDNLKNKRIERVKDGPRKHKFWEEFRNKIESPRTSAVFKNHFEMHLMSDLANSGLDVQDQVRICYAYMIQLTDQYLKELRKNAFVRVNSGNIIIEYVENGMNGLQLGRLEWRRMTEEEDRAMLKFIIDDIDTKNKSNGTLSPITKAYWQRFIEKVGSRRDAITLIDRLNYQIAPKIQSEDFDPKTKVKLYHALNIPIEDERRESFGEESDEMREEENEEKSTDSSELTFLTATSRQNPRNRDDIKFTEQDNYNMWQYVFQSVQNPRTDMTEKNRVHVDDILFWEGYRREFDLEKTAEPCMNHFLTKLVPNLHSFGMGSKTKIMLYYALDIPVNEEFLKKAQEKMSIEVDKNRRVLKYTSSEKRLIRLSETNQNEDILAVKTEEEIDAVLQETNKPETDDLPLPVVKTELEDVDLAILSVLLSKEEKKAIWNYILATATRNGLKKASVPWRETSFWEEFKTLGHTNRTPEILKILCNQMVQKLYFAKLTTQEKVILYYTMDVPIRKDFLELIRKSAVVNVDQRFCISKYKENGDGQVEFPKTNEKSLPSREQFSDGDDAKMWIFLIEKVEDAKTKRGRSDISMEVKSWKFWGEFRMQFRIDKSRQSCIHHFMFNMAPVIHSKPFDIQTKVDLYYSLRVPVDRDFLNLLSERVDVYLDNDMCLVECIAKNRENAPEFLDRDAKKRKLSIDVADLVGEKRIKEEPIEETGPSSLGDTFSSHDSKLIFPDNSSPGTVRHRQPGPVPSTGRSLKQYLSLFRNFVEVLNEPDLSDVELQVEAMIEDLGTGDVIVPVETLRGALEKSLTMIPKFIPKTDS